MQVKSINSINVNNKNLNFKQNPYFKKQANIIATNSINEIKAIKNLNIYDDNGENLLHIAAKFAELDVIKYLSKFININQSDLSGKTPIYNAIDRNDLSIVHGMHTLGAKLNIRNNMGETPLMQALASEDIFNYILASNVDVNAKNNLGNAPIHMVWDNPAELNNLKKYNANMNLKDGSGQNILFSAVETNNPGLIETHLNLGVDINATDIKNRSPIFYTKDLNTIDFLHKHGAKLDIQDVNGMTLAHIATKEKNLQFIDFLVNNSASFEIADKYGNTPIYYAIDNNDIFQKLINIKQDFNHQNKNGETILHKLANKGDVEKFVQITDLGGEPNIKNNEGKTALDIAKENLNYLITGLYETGTRGFSKVIGMDELKRELRETVIEPLTQREKYLKYGLKPVNGILLHGLPGCGKTFIVKALAEECGRNFYQLKPSDIASPYAGVGTLAIRELFERARQNPPSIVFIDELDGIPKRVSEGGDVNTDNNQMTDELLQQMNNLEKDNIVVIGATNNPEMIDDALKRPGRIDRKIFVPPPDLKARIGMFKMYMKDRAFEDNIEYKVLARKTENYIAKEIETIVNKAATAAMHESRKITMKDLQSAVSSVKPSISNGAIRKYRQKISITDTAGVAETDNNQNKVKGFAKVAGMEELKKLLKNDVIDAMEKASEYKKYGLEPLNGVLLYGPPGTGKTFIASALAEECGRYFIYVKPSDVLSPYYGESAQNIRRVFEEAEYNAPSIIFIDEIEALTPSRSGYGYSGGEANTQVTEFLQQLNNCAEKDIFVIAATNEPQNIDEAIRRVGRFDKTIFVGPPDFEARKELFKMKLANAYADFNIDCNKLAELTEYYTAEQINKNIIQEAARVAMGKKCRISENMLIEQIHKTTPELNKEKVEYYRQKI